jgi:hypothetical protein
MLLKGIETGWGNTTQHKPLEINPIDFKMVHIYKFIVLFLCITSRIYNVDTLYQYAWFSCETHDSLITS